MATYNGAAYVENQIASLVAQNYSDWRLLIRDDASCDATMDIIHAINRQDSRITVLEDGLGRVGVNENFHKLLHSAYQDGGNYFLLSDQDDVWQQDKLYSQLNAMQQLEQQFPESPLLVHSDMQVVDEKLERISPSFMHHQNINHEERVAIKVLLAQNFITGCTVLVNRRLLDIALPLPDEALMHDWWLALCAAVFGHIGYIDKPLVKYRQHGKNEVGAKHLGDYINPMHGKWKKHWLEGRKNLFLSMRQASALAVRVRENDPANPNLGLIESYATIYKASRLARIAGIRKSGVHMQSGIRQALMLSRLLLTPEGWHV